MRVSASANVAIIEVVFFEASAGTQEPQSATGGAKTKPDKVQNWSYRISITGPLCFLPHSRVIFLMFIKSIGIAFVGLVLSVASAWAEPSSIRGIVNDKKGQPIRGADIRVESRNGERLIGTVKTDANGRYISNGLPAGTYRITLVVNGVVKTSINNTTVESGEPTWLNFELTPASALQASSPPKKGKHWVWLPPFTGSRLPGRWVEVDENGGWAAAHASHEDVVRISGEELQRTVHSRDITRGR